MKSKLNKSDYIVLVIYYSVSSILNILEYKSIGNDLIEYFVDIPATIITSFIVILIFMYFLIPKYLMQKKYIAFILIALVVLTFFGTISDTLGFLSGGNLLSELPKWDRIILNGIYTSSNDVGLLLGILFTKKFYEGRNELTSIEKQQKENELKLLRSQLDPHFLFNNLNTLDALIDSNPTKAKEYINRLSLIYRYLIQTKDAEVMELSEEIDLAENYIFLIKTRFENDYQFNIEKKVSLSDKFIPTGAIQTLLENVVKHNKVLSSVSVKATIIIDENTLTISNTKTNNGINKDSLGTGIQNLKARYKLLTEKEVQIINTENEFKISIPIIKLSTDT